MQSNKSFNNNSNLICQYLVISMRHRQTDMQVNTMIMRTFVEFKQAINHINYGIYVSKSF